MSEYTGCGFGSSIAVQAAKRYMAFWNEREREVQLYHHAQLSHHLTRALVASDTPLFMSRSVVNNMTSAANSIIDAIHIAIDQMFGSDLGKIQRFLKLNELAWQPLATSIALTDYSPMARPDFVVGSDGLKFVEQNTTVAVGGYQQVDPAVAYFRDHPAMRGLRREIECDLEQVGPGLVSLVKQSLPAGGRMAVLDIEEQPNGALEDNCSLYLVDLLRVNGINAEWIDRREIDYRKDGVFVDNSRLDLIFRIQIIPTLLERREEFASFFAACAGKRVGVIGNASEILFWDKSWLGVVSERLEQLKIGEAQRKEIENFLPFTRILSAEPVLIEGVKQSAAEYALRNQQTLVLKRGNSFMSRHVINGPDITEQEWTTAISDALADLNGNWVIQRFVPSAVFDGPAIAEGQMGTMQFDLVCSPYLISQARYGSLVRGYVRNGLESGTGLHSKVAGSFISTVCIVND